MPRPRNVIPRFSVDKNGRAFTKVDGRFISLGRADDPGSKVRYGELLQRLAQGLPPVPDAKPAAAPAGLTVNELALAFLLHAKDEYLDHRTGKPSAEVDCYKSALRPVRELFGLTQAVAFGPNALRSVRERYIEAGWSRGFINKAVSRVRHVWRWAVARELLPAESLASLKALEPLKAGKSAARETKRRTAIPEAHIAAVRPFLSKQCRDLLDLLEATGARPSELLGLRPSMIDRTGPVWVARLEDHKNAHRGLERTLAFGPKAQAILQRRMVDDEPLFNIRRDSFSGAVGLACDKANVPRFTPYAMRHTRLTAVRDALGIEAAQAIAGHARPDMTAHYGAKMDRLAHEAAAKIG
jgi:integrase